MPSKLLALTDEQLTTVFNMTALWRAIAADASSKMWRSLGDLPELGDGVVARTCAEARRATGPHPICRARPALKYR
jgi:hypothetical protein